MILRLPKTISALAEQRARQVNLPAETLAIAACMSGLDKTDLQSEPISATNPHPESAAPKEPEPPAPDPETLGLLPGIGQPNNNAKCTRAPHTNPQNRR